VVVEAGNQSEVKSKVKLGLSTGILNMFQSGVEGGSCLNEGSQLLAMAFGSRSNSSLDRAAIQAADTLLSSPKRPRSMLSRSLLAELGKSLQ
jgi:hypothetical protein